MKINKIALVAALASTMATSIAQAQVKITGYLESSYMSGSGKGVSGAVFTPNGGTGTMRSSNMQTRLWPVLKTPSLRSPLMRRMHSSQKLVSSAPGPIATSPSPSAACPSCPVP